MGDREIYYIYFIQFLSSLICMLPGMTCGCAISFPAASLPGYIDPSNEVGIVMNEEEASWFGNILVEL